MKLIIKENSSHIKRHDFKSVKLHDQPAHGACALFRVSTLKLNGGYDEKFNCQTGLIYG